MLPSLVIAMTMASSLSASVISWGLSVEAKSTWCVFCNMGVTTMKMISRTSMMSAMGMTLGAAIWAPACGLYALGGYFFAPPGRVTEFVSALGEVANLTSDGSAL